MHNLLPGHNIYLVDLPLLIVLISLVYSATRFDEWGAILFEASAGVCGLWPFWSVSALSFTSCTISTPWGCRLLLLW